MYIYIYTCVCICIYVCMCYIYIYIYVCDIYIYILYIYISYFNTIHVRSTKNIVCIGRILNKNTQKLSSHIALWSECSIVEQ